jgi:hypothetical protein
MPEQTLQEKYDQLFEKAVKVREAQVNYFKFRTQADLTKSKNLERELDHLLQVEIKRRKSGQVEMF